MARLRTVLKNSVLYSASSIILRASSIIFFPIFSKYLTQADYGTLSIVQSITMIMATLASGQLHMALTRFLHEEEKEEKSGLYKGKLIGTILSSYLFSHLILIGLLLTFGSWILKPILNDIPFYPYVTFGLLGVFFTVTTNLYRIYLKTSHKGVSHFWFDICFFGLNIVLNLIFVVGFKMDVIGIIYSILINGILFSSYALIQLLRKYPLAFDLLIFRKITKYATPLVPFILLGFLAENADRLILNGDSGAASSGIYYIAVTFAAAFSMIKESILSAFTPWYFQNVEKEDEKQLSRMITIIFCGTGIAGSIAALFSYEALSILSSNPDLVNAWKFIPVLMLGYLIVFAGQLINLPTYYYKEYTKYLPLSNLAALFVVVSIALLTVADYGIAGVTGAKIAGYITMTLTSLIISKKASSLKFDIRAFTLIIIAISIVSIIPYINIRYPLLLSLKIILTLSMVSLFSLYTKRNFPEVYNLILNRIRPQK